MKIYRFPSDLCLFGFCFRFEGSFTPYIFSIGKKRGVTRDHLDIYAMDQIFPMEDLERLLDDPIYERENRRIQGDI